MQPKLILWGKVTDLQVGSVSLTLPRVYNLRAQTGFTKLLLILESNLYLFNKYQFLVSQATFGNSSFKLIHRVF